MIEHKKFGLASQWTLSKHVLRDSNICTDEKFYNFLEKLFQISFF